MKVSLHVTFRYIYIYIYIAFDRKDKMVFPYVTNIMTCTEIIFNIELVNVI